MKLLFVTSNKIGSRLIRWGLNSDCSHFAVCFDEQARGSGIIFHSILTGCFLEWFMAFKKTHQIIHALSFKENLSLKDEEEIYRGMLSEYADHGYDRWAFAYWCYNIIKQKLFGHKCRLPDKNAWQRSGYSLCTQLASGVPWIKRWAFGKGIDLEMISPHDLYIKLLETNNFFNEQRWVEEQNNSDKSKS